MDKMPDEIWANEHECWGERADTWPNAPQVKYVRADLNQPRTPKIDGLREAQVILKDLEQDITAVRLFGEGARKDVLLARRGLEALKELVRAQLAAQEGGAG